MSKWLSRKLFVTVGGAIVLVISAATGEQSWTSAGWQLISLIGAYLGIQGAQNAVDINAASKYNAAVDAAGVKAGTVVIDPPPPPFHRG